MREGVYTKVIQSKSRTFLALCFSFLFGLSVFSWSENRQWLFSLYISLIGAVFVLSLTWSKPRIRFISAGVVLFLLGAIRFVLAIPAIAPDHVAWFNGQKITFRAIVSDEPERRVSETKLIVMAKEGMGGGSAIKRGRVLVSARLYPEYRYGDELRITCTLRAPENREESNFRYDKYLARRGIWSLCAFPRIERLSSGNGHQIKEITFNLKDRVTDQAGRLWSEPNSSFVAGLLYGARSGLPADLTEAFSRTGLSHIIAISGMNIAIIVDSLFKILIIVGLFRRQAFWLVTAFIIVFVVFTGATASVVRAGIMAGLVLVASAIGRSSRIGPALLLSAAVMAAINPYVLVWDAGFQLSFLATLGLVYLSPPLERLFADEMPALVTDTLIPTLAAILATLPFMLFQFGRLSLVAPVANLLVAPVVPFIMLVSFAALLLGFFFWPLGQIVAWAAGIALEYVILVARFLGGASWSAINIRLPLPFMLGAYLYFFVYVQRKDKNHASKAGV